MFRFKQAKRFSIAVILIVMLAMIVVSSTAFAADPAAPVITPTSAVGDTEVKGASVAGAEVSATVNSGASAALTVGGDGSRFVPVIALQDSDEIVATDTAAGGVTLDPSGVQVAGSAIVDPPTIDQAWAGESWVNGTSVEGASIVVSVNGIAQPAITVLLVDGSWTVALGTPLARNDVVTAVATVDGVDSEPSEPMVVKGVVVLPLTINKVVAGDTFLSGTSAPGANITVGLQFIDGYGGYYGLIDVVADENGNWIASIADAYEDQGFTPVSITLKAGDIVGAWAWTRDDEGNLNGKSNNYSPYGLQVTVMAASTSESSSTQKPLPEPKDSLPKTSDTTTSVASLSIGALLVAGFALTLWRRSDLLLGRE